MLQVVIDWVFYKTNGLGMSEDEVTVYCFFSYLMIAITYLIISKKLTLNTLSYPPMATCRSSDFAVAHPC